MVLDWSDYFRAHFTVWTYLPKLVGPHDPQIPTSAHNLIDNDDEGNIFFLLVTLFGDRPID